MLLLLQYSSVLSHPIYALRHYPPNHVQSIDQESGLVMVYEMMLQFAPENEDQAGEGGREASAY